MRFWKKRSFLAGAAYYAIVCICIILFGSPLFQVLGFEFSGLIALFASIHLLYYGAEVSFPEQGEGVWRIIKNVWLPILFLISIPLFLSLVSAFFIPNCSWIDGILFYVEVVYPTALIAILCGIRFGMHLRSKRKTWVYLGLFWVGSLLLSLLPGYFSAKIYTYGWQYGYFPGIVWDEALELRGEYWISRIVEVAAIVSWLLYDRKVIQEKKTKRSGIRTVFFLPEYWVMTICLAGFGVFYVVQYSDYDLFHHLSLTIPAATNVTIRSAPGTLTEDEKKLECYNITQYVKDIDSTYGIYTDPDIRIYIFSSADDLYTYIGTREASITKPWRRSIYIAKQNLQSLKHELVHAILADYGSFPFDMSWSTGLTEGAAVAIEDDYDGIRSADELSASILHMHLAAGVGEIMQFSGFLSTAPSISYVLSGSFSKYLLHSFGPVKFLKVYNERNFEDIYSESIMSLDSVWKKNLPMLEAPMDHYDSLRTLYYFKRTSVLRQPCLRKIGKLLRIAGVAYKMKNYKLADSLYQAVITESGRIGAIRGRVLSQLHLNNPLAAMNILDSTLSANEPQNLPALRILRGDVIALATGDLKKASAEWEEAMKLELGDSYFLAAFSRLYFFGRTANIAGVQRVLKDLYGLENTKDKYALIFSIEPDSIGNRDNDIAFYESRLFFYSSYFDRLGNLQAAYKIFKDGEKDINEHFAPRSGEASSLIPGKKLFDRLIEKKYAYYPEAFRVQHSDSKIFP